ncbi:hypothetical protein ABPG77_003959 [Micractinium sp. CCAP 211/92]
MGQQLAKQIAEEEEMQRVHELFTLIPQAYREVAMLQAPALAEKASGIPATPGSHQARYSAAFRYWKMLCAEQQAIFRHWNSQNTEDPVPTPARTPPFCPPAMAQQAAEPSDLSPGHDQEVEPSTHNSGGSSQRGQHGGSSGGSGGSDDAAPAVDTELLESVPLLGGGGSQLAAVLRRRQGQPRV